MALLAMVLLVVACTPDPPADVPTRLQILTQLTWCGGVMPPPGEPWCHTSPTAAQVEVRQRRDLVREVATGADGVAIVDVAAGTYVIAVVDPPGYMQCDEPMVTVAAGTTASVVQTCTVFAP